MLGFKPGFAYLGLTPESLECPRHPTPRVRVPAGSGGARRAADGDLSGGLARRLAAHRPHVARASSIPGATSPRSSLPATACGSWRWPSCPSRTRPPTPRAGFAFGPGRRRARARAADDGAGRRPLRVGAGSEWGARARWTLAALAAANLRGRQRGRGGGARAARWPGPCSSSWRPSRFALDGRRPRRACSSAPTSATGRCRAGRASSPGPATVCASRGRRNGCRAYLALRGGIDVPAVLGSRATDLVVGIRRPRRPRACARATCSACERATSAAAPLRSRPEPYAASVRVRVVLGPQDDHFDAAAVARFLGDAWRVAASSDRIGLRLEGERLRHCGAGRDPLGRHAAGLDPGPSRRPADRDAGRRPDDRRLSEDRDGARRRPAAARAARSG